MSILTTECNNAILKLEKNITYYSGLEENMIETFKNKEKIVKEAEATLEKFLLAKTAGLVPDQTKGCTEIDEDEEENEEEDDKKNDKKDFNKNKK